MINKIRLLHPQGKKAVTIDINRFERLKKSILLHLQQKPGSSHTALLEAVTKQINTHTLPFEGSVEWYMEWVKLHLETENIIERVNEKPVIWRLKKAPTIHS